MLLIKFLRKLKMLLSLGIQCDIRRVAEHADFNLWRRTCRMISGEVVLPNTPTVTGYASYNPCDCRNNSAQTPAA